MSTHNLNEQVSRSLDIMNYDRSKTLLEQPESVMDRRYNIKTIPKPKTKKPNPCDGYESPKFCKSTFYQNSICPGSKNEFEWKNHCFFVLPDKSTVVGVNDKEKVEFIDQSFIREFYNALINEEKDYIKRFISKSDWKKIDDIIKFFKDKVDENQNDAIGFLLDTFNLGTVLELTNSEKSTFVSKFGITTEKRYSYTSPYNNMGGYTSAVKLETPQITYTGFYNENGDEYQNDSADLRSGFDKFIDDWGVALAVTTALGYAIAGAFTGGATWVLALEIAVELGLAGAFAKRAVDKELDSWVVGMELLFGFLPMMKLSSKMAGISNDTIKSIANKFKNKGFKEKPTEAEFMKFWISLSDEEAKTLKKILTQEDFLVKEIKKLVGKDQTLLLKTSFKEALEQNKKIQDIATPFFKSSAGRELGATGILMAITIALEVSGASKDEEFERLLKEFFDSIDNEDTRIKIASEIIKSSGEVTYETIQINLDNILSEDGTSLNDSTDKMAIKLKEYLKNHK